MRARRIHQRTRNRPQRQRRRQFMIDAEEFDFMDDLEIEDWMISHTSGGDK